MFLWLKKRVLPAVMAILMCFSAVGVVTAVGKEPSPADHLLIFQVYGGGGKGETPVSHSFIELYNPTGSSVSLEGYSLSYLSSRDTSGKNHLGSTNGQEVSLLLEGIVPAHSSFLIRCAEENAQADIFTVSSVDQEWKDRYIDNDQYLIRLKHTSGTVDAVAVNPDEQTGEGTQVPGVSKQKSVRRVSAADTDNNASDFEVVEYRGMTADEAEAVRPRSLADGEWQPGWEAETAPNRVPGSFNEEASLEAEFIARYDSGIVNADGGSAEIVKYNAENEKFYVVNGTSGTLDIVSMSGLEGVGDTAVLSAEKKLNLKNELEARISGFAYGDMTSVDVNTALGLIAVAVQAEGTADNGYLALLDYDGRVLSTVQAGCQPDMLLFTPDGTKLLSANEGEPRDGYGEGSEDPRGSVTIVDLSGGAEEASSTTVTFDSFDSRRQELIEAGVILQKGIAPSRDLEPEYIAVTKDSTTAYVSLQEANAVAQLDISSCAFVSVKGLGFKDYGKEENALDLRKNDEVNIQTENALGVYMPDGLAVYEAGGKTYLLTPNEGDSRDWPGYCNEEEIELDGNEVVALRASDYDGLDENRIYLYGGRSFSVFDAETMQLVFDSGSDFERITAELYPDNFNCSNDKKKLDNRSGKKGPEPEDIKVGTIADKTYAFIGLERVGGVMIYDITDPSGIRFENYINTRDYRKDIAGDVSPEGLCFISAAESPTGLPLLLAAHEVSGTVTVTQLSGRAKDDVVIIHTNDSHGRVDDYMGFSSVSALKKDYEALGYSVLLLDAGDTLHGLPIATIDQGESIVSLMNLAGYDAMTPGNHDFNYGTARLTELTGMMYFPLISANVKVRETGVNLFMPYTVAQAGGKQIGVFGLSTPETAYKTNPANVESIAFADPIEAAKEIVAELKEQEVDVIVALSHIGLDEASEITSEKIAAAVPGIDIIIDGHSHSLLPNGQTVGGTLIASTGEYIQNIGVVTLKNGEKSARLVGPSDYTGKDPAIDAKIEQVKAQQDILLKEVVGRTAVDLDGERQSNRTGETNLGNLVTDAFRAATGADVALTNGGGIRASVPAGDITRGNLVTVFPFGNYVVTKKVTGAVLKEALEWGVKDYPNTSGGFPQVSGVTFRFDPEAPAGSRIYEIGIGGAALDPEAVYLLATNDFMANGGDGYTMLGAAEQVNEYGAMEEILIAYIQTQGEVAPEVEGRIIAAKQEAVDPTEPGSTGPGSAEPGDAKPETTGQGSEATTAPTGDGAQDTGVESPKTGVVFPTAALAMLLAAAALTITTGVRIRKKS